MLQLTRTTGGDREAALMKRKAAIMHNKTKKILPLTKHHKIRFRGLIVGFILVLHTA